MEANASQSRNKLVGELVGTPDRRSVRHLFGEERVSPLADAANLRDEAEGCIVEVKLADGGIGSPQLLAQADSALGQMYRIAARHQLDPVFPIACEQQVKEMVANPGFDAPDLVDLRAMPFVSIDGPNTRDLDQAMYVAKENGELVVYYALADAAIVAPGSPLFEEALRRGSTYYLPGFAIPMLPRPLSEGIVSLNEKVDRRALVFRMTLSGDGRCQRTELLRGRIHSRGKLNFEQVQRHLEAPSSEPFDDDVARSLKLFQEVGELRMQDADRRDVISYRRTETEVKLSNLRGSRYVIVGGMRTMVERYNEQLSLLCNVEGARFLHRQAADHEEVQAIYRVHPSPDPRRYARLEDMLHAICKRHQLNPKQWAWRRQHKRSLADFLTSLPHGGEMGRLASAIHRQAVVANVRSTFSPEPGSHHGVGADVYARFSAPMREIVGVFLHKEAIEKLQGSALDKAAQKRDEALREAIVSVANSSKALQKRITKEANELVLDQLFAEDLKLPVEQRPVRLGTIMGLTPSKAHVQLDAPNIEVKLYTKHQSQLLNEEVRMSRDGVQLHANNGRPLCCLGDGVHVRLRDRDNSSRRWVLELMADQPAR